MVQVCFMVWVYTLWVKQTVPQIEFIVIFWVFKIQLQDFGCLYFHKFQAVCKSFVEINRIITNYCHFKVKWGQKQVSEIFRILQNCEMSTKLWLNNYILKSKYTKIGEGLLLFVEDGAAVDGHYYLTCWKTSLCNKEFILLEKVHCSTIIWGSLPDSKFCYQLSQWKCFWLYQRGKLIS